MINEITENDRVGEERHMTKQVLVPVNAASDAASDALWRLSVAKGQEPATGGGAASHERHDGRGARRLPSPGA